MTRPDHAINVALDIPFHDCDPLFVAWHGRYFEYLEAGRQELLASRKLDVVDLVELGYRLYVTDARCRYMFPLTYRDRVKVSAWFVESSPLIKVAYEVFNESKSRRAARAHTVLAVTDDKGEFLTEIPADVRARLPD